MLTYLLALAVGSSSLALYLSAFFYPDVYRKGDLIWSGVGLFYALVLWVCAERITGGVLLGQIASVSLIGWLGWQTLNSRLHTASNVDLQAGGDLFELPARGRVLSSGTTTKLKQQVNTVRDWAQALLMTTRSKIQSKPSETPQTQPYQPLKREDFGQPVTVETKTETHPAEAVQPEIAPVANQPNIISSVTEAVKSVYISFQKPKKNTSTYVRKGFRDAAPAAALVTEEPALAEDVDADAFDFEADSAVVADSVDQDSTSDSTIPVEEADEATIADAEDVDADAFDFEADPAVVADSVDQDGTSDSTIEADEIMLEEIEFEASRNDLEPPQPTLETIAPISKKDLGDLEPQVPQPVPPHPPSPDLVEAAIADAEAKHLPADPPEPIADPKDKPGNG